MSNVYPLWMLKFLPNMAACQIGIAQDARAHNNTITLEEVSGLLALIESASVIERGWSDVMIAGGAGSRISLTPRVYRGDVKLSHSKGDPTQASRPFDARREGLVNGEGAGVVILESREHAEARGAEIWMSSRRASVRSTRSMGHSMATPDTSPSLCTAWLSPVENRAPSTAMGR